MDNRNEEKDFRKDFPIFQQEKELIYLDNAATSHRPVFWKRNGIFMKIRMPIR